MTRTFQRLLPVVGFAFAFGVGLHAAQQSPPQPANASAPTQPAPPAVATPLKVQIVISRFQGEKKVGSVPYTLSVNANGKFASLRMGLNVAVPTGFNEASKTVTGTQYKDIGTNIDCAGTALDGGRFRLEISIEDSSLYVDDQAQAIVKAMPVFRQFRSMGQTVVLKDGQTTQYTMATDKVSGETVKVDVTLTVVKQL